MADHTDSPDKSIDLAALCRTGDLYSLERWIAEGRSLDLPVAKNCRRRTLLQVAVEAGFRSMVELIAKHEPKQEVKNAALRDAVRAHRLDLIELLAQNGAEVAAVPLIEVFRTWDPAVFRFFLERGADPTADAPFAEAFAEKIRTSLRAFVEYKTAHPDQAAALQAQADSALRHFAREGDEKWVSLMLWAGADPRSLGRTLEDGSEDPELYCSALQEACYAGKLEILKKFKPDPELDNLSELLHCAAISGNKELVTYLLERGAGPNDKANGGCSAIDALLWRLSLRPHYEYKTRVLRSSWAVSDTLDCIRLLAEHGAIWKPDGIGDLQTVRRTLLQCEASVTHALLQVLMPSSACSAELAEELVRTPRMREHLGDDLNRLGRFGLLGDELRAKRNSAFTRQVARRYNREELYEKVWAQPMRAVANQYGCSDAWLGRVCRALKIPVPGRGYWAKVHAGRPASRRPRLPTLSIR